MNMNVNMRALVILSAVLASAVARPGSLPPVADPESSRVPTARTSSSQEADVDDESLAQVPKSLQNPAPDSSGTSRLDNPTLSPRISDDTTGIRFVDNPHIGLPFGAVLPAPDRVAPAQASPTPITADTLNTFRRDSPHVGLPPIIPSLDSPASTASASSPTSIYQRGTSPDGTIDNTNIHTEVPSMGDDASSTSINTSPASVNVNRVTTSFGGLPNTQFSNCNNPGFFKVSSPNSLTTHGTHVSTPASSPFPQFTSNAGVHDRSGSANLPTIDGYSNFLVSNSVGGFFTETVNSKFGNTPSSITSNPPSYIPVNAAPSGFPNRNPNNYPLTNIASTANEPTNLFLFSENVPHANVVSTAQGQVVVGGPGNMAVFPKQPSLDDINQVLAAHEELTVPAAGGPASRAPADTTT